MKKKTLLEFCWEAETKCCVIDISTQSPMSVTLFNRYWFTLFTRPGIHSSFISESCFTTIIPRLIWVSLFPVSNITVLLGWRPQESCISTNFSLDAVGNQSCASDTFPRTALCSMSARKRHGVFLVLQMITSISASADTLAIAPVAVRIRHTVFKKRLPPITSGPTVVLVQPAWHIFWYRSSVNVSENRWWWYYQNNGFFFCVFWNLLALFSAVTSDWKS